MAHALGHELPADKIKTLQGVRIHLCDLAYHSGKIWPDKCENCISSCKYGMKMLELMGKPKPPWKRETGTISKLSRNGEVWPSVQLRIRKRGK